MTREGGSGRPEDPVQQAKDICLRLLTARPRTRTELAQALARKGVDSDVADQVLGRLDEVGLIDDAAFAEVWVRSRHNFQGLSRRALAVELRRKGVADESAAEALAAVDGDAEEERARQLVRKRLRVLGDADEATKIRRLVGMLARKGYSEGLAYRVVKDELRTSLLDETF
ncbi:regulatory protein RecX [Actinophytocola sp.]|uniref:regulatory protein RecX n=1 Tax=Actinophytocola sp. TaxID=1872138 RepID=UPI002ED14B78